MYIYILRKNNVIFYVGKTKNPKRRLLKHRIKYGKYIQLKLIDFADEIDSIYLEYFYIKSFISKGLKLKNKSIGIIHNGKCSPLLNKVNPSVFEGERIRYIKIQKNPTPIKRDDIKFNKFLSDFEDFIKNSNLNKK